MADSNDLRVSLTGLEETLKALKKYDPEARKELFNAVQSATRLIRDDARAHIGQASLPSGWRKQTGMPSGQGSWANRELTRGGRGWPAWEPNNIKRLTKSYMSARRARKGSILTTRGIVVNASGEGIIYEFAKQSHRSTKYPWVNSKPFINKLGSVSGGRFIWAAGERKRNEVQTRILDALAVANAKLQAHFDAVKEGDR